MALNPLNAVSKIWAALKVKPADPQRSGLMSGLLSIFGGNASGVNVTHEEAFRVSVVWACMDIIASALSSSSWNVYGGLRGDDKTTALPRDGLQYVLNTRFNLEMTAQAGKRALMLAAVGYGNGYAEIERDLAGRIIALWPISPDRVEPRRDMETGRLFFRVTQEWGGGFVDMDASDIYHVRGASLVGFVGDDVVRRAITTISEAIALSQFSSAYFGNNTQLGTIFTYKRGKIDDAHYERLKKQIEERHRGARKAFKFGLFDGDWDVKQIGSDADKSQLVESKQQIIEDVCRFYHVPPHKVQHLLRATNNNIEHQGLEFSRDTLRPWKVEIEQEADYKLIPYRGPSKFVEIDLDWAEQGDYKSRVVAYQILRSMGAFSANDVLRKLGENTIGAAGDIRIVQGANVRLEDVGKNMVSEPQPASPDPEDEEDESATVQAWLTTVYQRIERRVNNRAKTVPIEKARQDSREYAEAAPEELGFSLGDKLPAAKAWALRVLDGVDPATAAKAVMKGEA